MLKLAIIIYFVHKSFVAVIIFLIFWSSIKIILNRLGKAVLILLIFFGKQTIFLRKTGFNLLYNMGLHRSMLHCRSLMESFRVFFDRKLRIQINFVEFLLFNSYILRNDKLWGSESIRRCLLIDIYIFQ